MLPVALAVLGTHARPPTVAFLGWFGPRGLASIVFAVILVEEAALPHQDTILLAVVATVTLSVYAHGLSAQPLTKRYAGWYERQQRPGMESIPAAEHLAGRVRD
jgi:sodium/hydrogen antiporter